MLYIVFFKHYLKKKFLLCYILYLKYLLWKLGNDIELNEKLNQNFKQ